MTALRRDPDWPEGFYWDDDEGRPVYVSHGAATSECERLRQGLIYLRDMTPAGNLGDGAPYHNAKWVSAIVDNILAGHPPLRVASDDPHA